MFKKLFRSHRCLFTWGPVVCLLLLLLAIQLPAIFTNNHYLFNLEPYPDGIWYALSARNLILHGQLSFLYQGSSLQLPVPQLYPLFLSLGYLIWQAPQMFFITNLVLLLASCFLLFQLVRKLTHSIVVTTISLGIYLSHAYILWLPTLPMTENLALFLLITVLYFFFTQKFSLRSGILITLFSILLLFTRYSLIVTTIICLGLLFSKTFQTYQGKAKRYLLIGLTLFGLLFVGIFSIFAPHYSEYISRAVQEIIFGSPYFGLHFIPKNLVLFFKTFLGFKNNFLWETTALTSFPIFLFFILGLFTEWKEKNYYSVILLTSIFLSLLVAPALFYSQDSRYLVLTIIPFTVGSALFFKNSKVLQKKYNILFYSFIGLGLIFHLFLQRPLLQKIIASNVLHRSTAWQYQAVQHFDTTFKDIPNVQIITAMPPYLVDAYSTENYRVLPLSRHQEFLDKRQRVWGDDLPYDNLLAGYEKMLLQGKRLFISNAYITHNHKVIEDYKKYTEKFVLTPVEEGCLDTCSIYQLQLK